MGNAAGECRRVAATLSDGAALSTSQLSIDQIKAVLQGRIMQVKKRSREMGIWQLAAAANAIGRPVLSVYPHLGWESYQTVNNRMLMPATADPSCAQKPLRIMWTSSRKDMTPIHWTADHFVPLLPLTDPDQEVLVTVDEDNAPPLLPDISTTPAVDLQEDELYFVL